MTDREICAVFRGAGDFVRRELSCGGLMVYAYFIDGLTAGGEIAEYVFKPLYENRAKDMEAFYQQALGGGVYSATAAFSLYPCKVIFLPGLSSDTNPTTTASSELQLPAREWPSHILRRAA